MAFSHRHYLCGMDRHGFECTSKDCEAQLKEKEVTLKQLKQWMKKMLGEFSKKEQQVLDTRFGLFDGVAHTLEEVGEKFGVTRERIRQIEAKALEKFAKQINRKDDRL